MESDREDPQSSPRRERIGSYPQSPNTGHSAAINHSPVSSWVGGHPLPDSDNISTEQSQSGAEKIRAPPKRSTSPRHLDVRQQADFDSTTYSKGQQQADDKKPESKSKSRYDDDSWGIWDSNAQSQPAHHRGYRQEYPQLAPGASSYHDPFAPSVLTPYGNDSRYVSANYDYRPYVVDRLNPLVRNPPIYKQPWTQPTSTVSMPYSLMETRLDTGVKDFSSYSFAPPPPAPGSENGQGHGIPGSSHSLPDRLHTNSSEDSDDDNRGVVLPSDGLHAEGSSQSKESRERPINPRAELSVAKGSLDSRTTPIAVSPTLGGAEAVQLPPSRSHSPLELDSTLDNEVLPPLPPLPESGGSSPGRPDSIQGPFSQKWPYTTEHNKASLEHSHTVNEVAPEKGKTPNDEFFGGINLSDVLRQERVAEARVAKTAKNKGKAAKRTPVVVNVPPPPPPPPMRLPLPPDTTGQPSFQFGQEPEVIDIVGDVEAGRASPPKKPKQMRVPRSAFTDWIAGKRLRSSRQLPTSSYAQRVHSLIPCMPHLGALYSFTRHPETGPVITRLDYKDNIEDPRRKSKRTFRSSEWLDYDSKTFAKKLSSGGTSSAFLRVLFVEDLTEALIDTLGTLYGVDPELFASHMSSSGSSTLSYDDPPPARWSTAKMRKSYYSLKWYRPVRLEKKVSQWLQSKEDVAKLGGEGLKWSETTYERRGQNVRETKTHHNVTLDSNIFRRSWPLSSDPDGTLGGGLHAAWEEKASVFITSKEGLRTMIILLDPLPALVDTQTTEETLYANRLSLPLAKGRKTSRTTTTTIAAFQTIAPRAPTNFPANKLDASDGEIQSLSATTSDTASTSADIESWIWRLHGLNKTIRSGTTDPLVAVLRLACIDSTDYLDHLSWTLDEITRHSLDESIMIKRLPAWRKLLSDLEIELPTLEQDLHDFIEPTHAAFSEVADMLNDIDNRIAEVLSRVRNVYAVLRSEMALLDSSRSIAEARTVAKLTELAFAFIPLTFACSIFSMQIRELQNGAPFWAFLVTAVAMGMITYAVRLVLQSNALSKMRRDATIRMMASGSSVRDQDITTGMLFRHLIGRLWQQRQPVVTVVVFLTALAIPVIPIGFLWSRNHMDVGFNAMLTVLTIPAGIMLAWYAQSAVRDATGDTNESDDESSMAHLSMSEWLAMRVAPFLGRRKRRNSVEESTSDEDA